MCLKGIGSTWAASTQDELCKCLQVSASELLPESQVGPDFFLSSKSTNFPLSASISSDNEIKITLRIK